LHLHHIFRQSIYAIYSDKASLARLLGVLHHKAQMSERA
jgi:hypothetical protein